MLKLYKKDYFKQNFIYIITIFVLVIALFLSFAIPFDSYNNHFIGVKGDISSSEYTTIKNAFHYNPVFRNSEDVSLFVSADATNPSNVTVQISETNSGVTVIEPFELKPGDTKIEVGQVTKGELYDLQAMSDVEGEYSFYLYME